MYQDSSTPHIILWGHSLGTSIATRTLATLETQEEASMIKGLVLESPFNKMEDEVKSFSAVKWTSWLLGVVKVIIFYQKNLHISTFITSGCC